MTRQSGFGPPPELMFFLVAFGLATAAWIPHVVDRDARRARHACAVQVEKLLVTGEPAVCPLSGEALTVTDVAAAKRACCPTPERHGTRPAADTLCAGVDDPSAVVARNPAVRGWPFVIGGWLLSVAAGLALVAGFFRFLAWLG